MKPLLCAAIIGLFATTAMAHSPLRTTSPRDAAVIAEAPQMLQLTFQGTIRLTRVSVAYGDGTSGDLALGAEKNFRSDYAIPFQPKGSGRYVIEWRGLGADGHVMKGSFGFEVE